MDREIRKYRKELDRILATGNPGKNKTWIDVETEFLTRTCFFQHERLVHLIVTMTVAVLTVLTFLALWFAPPPVGIPQLALMGLLLVLLVPYVGYYFTLENEVQGIYKYFLKIREKEINDQ